MSESIKISEGLQFYFANGEQQAAIDQIVGQNKIPIDLSWEKVEQFNDARLSAHSIQVDCWKLLNNIWIKTWGRSIDLKKYNDVEPKYYERNYSVEYIWNNYLYKAFEYNGNTLLTYCYATITDGVCIGFSVLDEKEYFEVSTDLKLSESWLVEKGDEYVRWTKTKLLPIRGQEEINIDELSKLAKEVMLKLEAAM